MQADPAERTAYLNGLAENAQKIICYILYGFANNYMSEKVLTQRDVYPADDVNCTLAWLQQTHRRVLWTCKFMLIILLILINSLIAIFFIYLADFQSNTSVFMMSMFPATLKPETEGMERHPAILMNLNQRRVQSRRIPMAIFTMPFPIFDVHLRIFKSLWLQWLQWKISIVALL